ncbi:MAG: lipid-binding SYLF domain-containing protein [Nitrospiraceae bacterium]
MRFRRRYLIHAKHLCCMLTGLLMTSAATPALGADIFELKELVDEARLTLARFVGNPNMIWLRDHIKEAKGIVIVPRWGEAGYVIAGSYGRGVFLARDEETGRWSEPAFYTFVGGSFGLQIGAKTSESLALVMTQNGVDAMLSSTFVAGVGATVAAGPFGGDVSGGTAPNLSADIISFANSKGAFIGLAVGGTSVFTADESNRTYYGKPVIPADILVKGEISNSYSARIRATADKADEGMWQIDLPPEGSR